MFIRLFILFSLGFTLLNPFLSPAVAQNFDLFLFSPLGTELEVTFQAKYLTEFKSLEQMNRSLGTNRNYYINQKIDPTLKFLFGPLTHRGWAGVKATKKIDVNWSSAVETERGVEVPYTYIGIWLVDVNFMDQSTTSFVPVPFNLQVIYSTEWKRCSDMSHDSSSSFWYYWDPERIGCDQTNGNEFQNVSVSLSNPSSETKKTYPEYQKLIQQIQGKPTLPMTIAFGYVEEVDNPNPEQDMDLGAGEYREFIQSLKALIPEDAKVEPIMRGEYPYFRGSDYAIGKRYLFTKDGVQIILKVVTNAGIDQMILFARSYAEEHDSYFAWLGHSRVGSGFDAARFSNMLRAEPNIYSLTKNYQLVYWGGCNSYSYYTEPFFKMKAKLSADDPNGTRYLDIIANGLPSYFVLNASNALIPLKALLNWNTPTSYQTMLQEIEDRAQRMGIHVLAVVIGDEDNHVN